VTTGPFNDNDVWVYDLGGRPPIPLATEDDDGIATWNPDGTRIAFLSIRHGAPTLYTTRADGSVLDRVSLGRDGLNATPAAWSDGDELILVRALGPSSDYDIVAISADGSGEVRDVVATPADEYDAALSPNGRWLAYTSDRTDEPEIWVKGYPDGGPIRISHNGGHEPIWSPDGQELFYLQGNTMMSVSVDTEGSFSFDPAVELFTSPYLATEALFANSSSYDVARDGRFLMIQASLDSGQPAEIVVVQNWFEELNRRVPTN
jgi:Tol biopolymer transport system component